MIKKTITYTDYNGQERTEDFYFNLSKAELVEMEMSINGGLGKHIQDIIDANNAPEIMKSFKEIIIKSYGVKSQDGKRFIKNEEVSNAFIQSEAYSTFFMELIENTDAAVKFVNGLIPSGIVSEQLKNN